MKKYKQTHLQSLNIANDGRQTLVEVSADNRGDTLITFGAGYTLRVNVEDLEGLVEALTNAYEDHKDRAIKEVQGENQSRLPFNELSPPHDDPRNW